MRHLPHLPFLVLASLAAVTLSSCALFGPAPINALTSYTLPDADEIQTVEFRTVLKNDTIDFGAARVRIVPVAYVSHALTGMSIDSMRITIWAPPMERMRRDRAVLLVHGFGAGIESEHALALAIARRGYPCVLVSLRGANANNDVPPTYGLREVDDLTDVMNVFAEWSHQSPDSLRAAVFGSSLGGVVVLNAAAVDPRIAVVATEGVMWDLERAALQLLGKSSVDEIVAGTGVPDAPAAFRALSPSAAAGRLPAIPLMLVWGEKDMTVPQAERRLLADSTRAHASRVEMVEVPNGDHSLRYGFPLTAATATALNERIAAFFAEALQ